MLDTYVAQLILDSRQTAYLIADRILQVVGSGGAHKFLATDQPIVGRPLPEIVPELIGYEEDLAALLDGQLASIQIDLINRDAGATAALEQPALNYIGLSVHPYQLDGQQISGLLLILEDTTQLGESSQRITQQHNELYLLHEQLRKSNLQLAAANAELRALDELKSRFVSIAAHELRTPIASLIGYVDFILQDELEPLTKNQRSSLDVVQRSGRRLLAITSDLLDLTRLEAGRMELMLESVNLYALVQAIIIEFQPEIQAKELAVDYHVDHTLLHNRGGLADILNVDELGSGFAATLPAVLCDEKRTIQIFTNLISNAIKYTPTGGKISIRFGFDALTESVFVQVIDTGIGIPADDLRLLGKAFFRAKNVYKARTNGTGLGIHITHSLIELQGGTLQIESTEGEGTTVTVALPFDDGLLIPR